MWKRRTEGSPQGILVDILTRLRVLSYPKLRYKASPNNEQFLTDKEVSAWLKVSRRTLQDYRNNGMVSYYQLGGKILYKESDIERMVMSGYRNAYRLET